MEAKLLVHANRCGFETAEEMIREMYVVDRMSASKIAQILGIGAESVRRRLRKMGIESIRSRPFVHVTEALVSEVRQDGTVAVARRLGVSDLTLSRAIMRYEAKTGRS